MNEKTEENTHDFMFPRRMCYDYISPGVECKYMRRKKAWLVDDIICYHPRFGKYGGNISHSTIETFRTVGCHCFELDQTKRLK